jgi:hypothetical protein
MHLFKTAAVWTSFAIAAKAWKFTQSINQGCTAPFITNPISGSGAHECENLASTPGSFNWEGQNGFQLIIFFEPNCGTGISPQGFARSGCEDMVGPLGAASFEVAPCTGCTA